MIRRVAASIGTARPSPIAGDGRVDADDAAAESASAPPELPGLSAASVWMTFSTSRLAWPSRAASDRPSALTTPAVTEPGEAERVADRHDELADPQPGRVAERRGGEVAARRPDDGQVRERIAADDLERELVAVDERGGSPLRAGDDVGVRDEDSRPA